MLRSFSLLNGQRFTAAELVKEFGSWWSFRHCDLSKYNSVFEKIPSKKTDFKVSPVDLDDMKKLSDDMSPRWLVMWEQNNLKEIIYNDYSKDPKNFNFNNIIIECRKETFNPVEAIRYFNFLGCSCAVCGKFRKLYGDEQPSLTGLFRGSNEYIRGCCPLCIDCEKHWYKFNSKKEIQNMELQHKELLFLKHMIKYVGNSH